MIFLKPIREENAAAVILALFSPRAPTATPIVNKIIFKKPTDQKPTFSEKSIAYCANVQKIKHQKDAQRNFLQKDVLNSSP